MNSIIFGDTIGHARVSEASLERLRKFLLAPEPIEATPGPEMASVFWVPLEALPATPGTSTVTTILGELIVPAFAYEGRLIWGFTYRILEELLVFVGLSA